MSDVEWGIVRRSPPGGLAAHISRYCGYASRCDVPVRLRQVPTGQVTVILSFGDQMSVSAPAAATSGRFGSLVAGLDEHATITEHVGRLRGMQLDLTPLGAYRLLGMPMRELANSIVELDALPDRPWSDLVQRVAHAPDWDVRFALLDAALLGWADDGPAADPAVTWAWRSMVRSHGRVPVGRLAEEIGWSRRHFAARFREQVGLAPKSTASVLRFRRAAALLTDGRAAAISDVAATCGYADHSHLVREFRRLAGCTPSAYLTGQTSAPSGSSSHTR